jgi:hypothetical protein
MRKIILIVTTGVILWTCLLIGELAKQRAVINAHLPQSQTQTTEETHAFVLGSERGRLVVYRKGESEPYLTTDTFTYSLPKSDRRRLEQEGIEIEGEDKLRRVLEDYGS